MDGVHGSVPQNWLSYGQKGYDSHNGFFLRSTVIAAPSKSKASILLLVLHKDFYNDFDNRASQFM